MMRITSQNSHPFELLSASPLNVFFSHFHVNNFSPKKENYLTFHKTAKMHYNTINIRFVIWPLRVLNHWVEYPTTGLNYLTLSKVVKSSSMLISNITFLLIIITIHNKVICKQNISVTGTFYCSKSIFTFH